MSEIDAAEIDWAAREAGQILIEIEAQRHRLDDLEARARQIIIKLGKGHEELLLP